MDTLWQAYYFNDEWKVTQNFTLDARVCATTISSAGSNWTISSSTSTRTDSTSPISSLRRTLRMDEAFSRPTRTTSARASALPGDRSSLKDTVIRAGLWHLLSAGTSECQRYDGRRRAGDRRLRCQRHAVRPPDVFFSNPFVSVQQSGPTYNNTTSIDPEPSRCLHSAVELHHPEEAPMGSAVRCRLCRIQRNAAIDRI